MTDALKKMALALGHPHNTAARDDAGAALATLNPGCTWTTDDGVEVMVVPVALPATGWAAAERYLDSLGPSGSVHQGSIWKTMLSAIRNE